MKCPKCQSRKGKRHCPALLGEICPRCCGEHRLKTIDCPRNCPYLKSEFYQQERRQNEARRSGDEFLHFTHALYEQEDEQSYAFAILLQADIYLFMTELGDIENAEVARALEELKDRSTSRLVLPTDSLHPLAAYLDDRLKNSERYGELSFLSDSDRQAIVSELARRVRIQANDKTFKYHELIGTFFDRVDLDTDFGFTPEDTAALRGDTDEGDSFRRSSGGVILPS